ncbi:N-acetylornithine carbamoyltransferase [Catalinimonas niigatensis]|uniref:N-acetylornithine carbamoyltransferase n=1 Tax=Catalinimonas niigatensis TaxID=1397264 RepID=UPI0026667AC1|nr:N-acetylornithine carbamoyltransferase [Catalinimonas niigatensis]WPP51249.1 N-acetylornithine carbamoyltransferase [Catalinimonas niigatensis]
MKHFTSVKDVADLDALLKTAFQVKQSPYGDKNLATNKSMCLIFLNPSLRTRLSTQKAAMNLGLDTVVFDMNQGGWNLEFQDGSIMNGDKPEHVKEAAAVIGQYYGIIGIRAFAHLKNPVEDYAELVIRQFQKYAGVPVISLESPVRHPLQSLTDLITIEEHKTIEKPKIVLSWAPHPKALPQAVANSFLEWMVASGQDITLTHPEGYELDEQFTEGVKVVYDQRKAFEEADFIYAKNWSSYKQYGAILEKSDQWTITADKMKLTNQAKFMHCLPVRRNVIVADEVIDSSNSIVIQQAANRVVAAQAVIKMILQS